VLRILKDLFQAAGANVFGSTSGVEGLRQFHAHRPDLLILDLILPDLSGWEMYCRIGDSTRAPVIFLTGLPEQYYHPPGLSADIVDYVAKPFSPVELLRHAREALGDRLASPKQGGKGASRSSPAHRPDVRGVSTRHQSNVHRLQAPEGVSFSLGGVVVS
jgi:DNA-binding response OmpR family regulator